jgi:hypothetical protein
VIVASDGHIILVKNLPLKRLRKLNQIIKLNISKSCQLMKNEHRSSSQPTHNVIAIESMNLGSIAEPKHRSDKVNREVTTGVENW